MRKYLQERTRGNLPSSSLHLGRSKNNMVRKWLDLNLMQILIALYHTLFVGKVGKTVQVISYNTFIFFHFWLISLTPSYYKFYKAILAHFWLISFYYYWGYLKKWKSKLKSDDIEGHSEKKVLVPKKLLVVNLKPLNMVREELFFQKIQVQTMQSRKHFQSILTIKQVDKIQTIWYIQCIEHI